MKILLFGATGMVGQGVLRECLAANDVTQVVTVGRKPTDITHERLAGIVTADLFALETQQDQLAPFDACFFCLGVSSLGMKEPEYTRITYELTLRIAQLLLRLNPQMVFVYVSGAGTDSTENGKLMWARVKGRTENALIALDSRARTCSGPASSSRCMTCDPRRVCIALLTTSRGRCSDSFARSGRRRSLRAWKSGARC
jgi:uncharacterized protein YbjT (DUF2867 family)